MPQSKRRKVSKPRNPFVIPAKNRKAGSHKDKRSKRAQENKSQDRFLDEEY